MIELKREPISEKLVSRLGELLWKGDSIVLLGPRNVGKRYLTRRLGQHLARRGRGRLASVAFIDDLGDASDRIGDLDTGLAGDRLPADFTQVLQWVDARLAEGPEPVTLIASNVDARPNVEIQEFLSALGSRIEGKAAGAGSLSVALTGEMDLSRFTYGPQPALTCRNQFVIQGFALDEFKTCVRSFFRLLKPPGMTLREKDIERLYERTGGNTYFFRLLLWSAFDGIALEGRSSQELFGPELGTHDYQLPGYYFRYISHLIDANPSCWPDLERLIAGEEMDCPERPPHALELAGVAVRDRGRLRMSSPLVRDYVRRHYTPRRFADLYAREGDWVCAFERYHRVDPAARLRPTDLEDLGDAELAVRNLRTSLYHAATKDDGPESVLRLFCDGCRYVLGFGEVTCWRHIREWDPVDEEPFDRPAEGIDYRGVLGRIGTQKAPGRVHLGDELSYHVVAVYVATDHPDVHQVVLVGRPGQRNILSAARERMTHTLVDDFVSAYAHALQDQLHRQRRDFQKQFQEDLAKFDSDITARLGSEIVDVQGVLKEAAKRLRGLGYSRVVFSVLDPARRKAISVAVEYDQAVYGDVPPRWPPMPLEGDRRSAARWVVEHRKPLVTADAVDDKRVRKAVAVEFKIKGMAVVPIYARSVESLDPAGEVVGTIQVELPNGLRPTDEEINDLLDFGGKLAVTLALIEQVAMLQAALGALREPIAIFGHDGRVRFVNFWAAAPVGLKSKWYPAGQGSRYDELPSDGLAMGNLSQFVEVVRCSLQTAKSMFQPSQAEYQGRTIHFATRVEPLWDWRRQLKDELEVPGTDLVPADSDQKKRELLAGVLLHARDDTALRLTFQALEVLLERAGRSDEVVARTIQATKVLGHRWARLYKTDPKKPWLLISADGFGFPDEAVAARFRAGEFPLDDPRDGQLWGPWYCFEVRQPVALTHDPYKADRAVVRTDNGLEAINCRQTGAAQEFHKNPGDFWIDFPLEVDGTRIGKLTLECPENLKPDHLEFLGILCKLTSALLRASLENEKDLHEKALDYERTAERTIHEVIDKIQKCFSALSPAILRLRIAADDLHAVVAHDPRISAPAIAAAKQLAEARDRVNAVYSQIHAEIAGLMRQKLDEPVKTLRTDLYSLFSKLASSHFEGAEVRTDPPSYPGAMVADVDAARFLQSLERLVQTAARFSGTKRPVRVAVSAAIVSRAGAEWVAITVVDDGTAHGDDGQGEPRLAEVRAMAEAHGGSVRQAAADGHGSIFVIEFPRFQDNADPGDHRAPGAKATARNVATP